MYTNEQKKVSTLILTDISESRNVPINRITPLKSSWSFLSIPGKQKFVRLQTTELWGAEHKTPKNRSCKVAIFGSGDSSRFVTQLSVRILDNWLHRWQGHSLSYECCENETFVMNGLDSSDANTKVPLNWQVLAVQTSLFFPCVAVGVWYWHQSKRNSFLS